MKIYYSPVGNRYHTSMACIERNNWHRDSGWGTPEDDWSGPFGPREPCGHCAIGKGVRPDNTAFWERIRDNTECEDEDDWREATSIP